MEFAHLPVLLKECIEGLNIRTDGVYVDGTLGRAGHSFEIAKRLKTGRLICIDRDAEAIEAGKERLSQFSDRVTFVRGNFRDIDEILIKENIEKIDGILLDLGVSSPQLDDAARGFSYKNNAPLDMRMDKDAGFTAYDVINTWTYEELKRIFFEYGEERYAPLIASAIVRSRDKKPVEGTLELAEIIKSAMPAAAKREKQHPAKRTFQAVRIAVNDELGSLSQGIRNAVPRLCVSGRMAVVSFHSLEDRIIKNAFNEFSRGCVCPSQLPVCVCGKTPVIKIINKKPVIPDDRELLSNPRVRSAKLRIIEKI